MSTHVETLRSYALAQRRRGLLGSSIERTGASLRAYVDWLDGRAFDDVTAEDVERFLDGRNLSARGRYCWLSILHNFYAWGNRTGALATNPVAEIIRPRLRPTLPRPIGDAELAVALRNAPVDLHAWLALGAFAGLRAGEVAAMAHDWLVHLPAGDALRVLGKGTRERLVPIHPIVAEALRRHGLPRHGRVFRRPDGSPWTAAQVSSRANRWFRSIGIAATFHQTRHWFATNVLALTGDLRTTQDLLGHSSPATTAIYTKVADARRFDAVAQLRPMWMTSN